MGQAKELLEQEYRALNARDLTALAALYSDTADAFMPGGAHAKGGHELATFVSVYLTAFPDCEWWGEVSP